mmetsp:Transcript_21546/g.55948  ORF Transcript_21546/g.55948 Transcript_21546/m.55948 type:complete len:110 (-) Transcript_21546:505-834(-)
MVRLLAVLVVALAFFCTSLSLSCLTGSGSAGSPRIMSVLCVAGQTYCQSTVQDQFIGKTYTKGCTSVCSASGISTCCETDDCNSALGGAVPYSVLVYFSLSSCLVLLLL